MVRFMSDYSFVVFISTIYCKTYAILIFKHLNAFDFEQAVERWEAATELILLRESLLIKLEQFERNASDPNRFFEKTESGKFLSKAQQSYFTCFQ